MISTETYGEKKNERGKERKKTSVTNGTILGGVTQVLKSPKILSKKVRKESRKVSEQIMTINFLKNW